MQMMGRPLMTPDELKSMPKGRFVVAKTGCYPMQSTLKLFSEWGIAFDRDYALPRNQIRTVEYADRLELEDAILKRYPSPNDFTTDDDVPPLKMASVKHRGNLKT